MLESAGFHLFHVLQVWSNVKKCRNVITSYFTLRYLYGTLLAVKCYHDQETGVLVTWPARTGDTCTRAYLDNPATSVITGSESESSTASGFFFGDKSEITIKLNH